MKATIVESVRLGTIRRNGHTLIIDHRTDSDATHHFDLAATDPGQHDRPIGTIALTTEGVLLADWDDEAAPEYGIQPDWPVERGIKRLIMALGEALDDAGTGHGRTAELEERNGFKPHRDCTRLSSQETGV